MGFHAHAAALQSHSLWETQFFWIAHRTGLTIGSIREFIE